MYMYIYIHHYIYVCVCIAHYIYIYTHTIDSDLYSPQKHEDHRSEGFRLSFADTAATNFRKESHP